MPAEYIRLIANFLGMLSKYDYISNYPAKEYHHYCPPLTNEDLQQLLVVQSNEQNWHKTDERQTGGQMGWHLFGKILNTNFHL